MLMMNRKTWLLIFCMLLITGVSRSFAQQNIYPQSSFYEYPKDSLVAQKLDKWRDQKFGIIIHWGLYAIPGIIESWSICSEDWITRDSTSDYDAYKKWYWGLSKSFNPVNFNPDKWASLAKAAGMRYLVFTTKHHDGFCMFDTKQTDFKITNGPFAANPKANVAKFVFDAFRRQGFMIGAYFSKPDWHSPDYWWPMYATPNRNNNYDIRKFPWRWNQFKKYTYNQLSELMHGYGSIDILWLDGGWVRPLQTVNNEVHSWGAPIPAWSQDIDMPSIARMARKAQPGILMVDRTVHGPYENYQTPEQKIPDSVISNPWESCMTLGDNWGYVPNDHYKSPRKVISSLVEIVAKGGSLLLGVGPDGKGEIPSAAADRMLAIGKWLDHNGAAIYNTRSVAMFKSGDCYFTGSKDHHTRYAILCLKEGQTPPSEVSWEGNLPHKGSILRLLQNGARLNYQIEGNRVKVKIPQRMIKQFEDLPALAFSFVPNDND